MKRLTLLVTASLFLAIAVSTGQAANWYFDQNDDVAGSGVTSQVYNWTTDGSGLLPGFWNTNNADGTQASPGLNVSSWVNGNDAIFSAGTDATGVQYGVNIGTGVTATSATIEEGQLQVSAGVLDTGTGATTVDGTDATLEIASTLRLNSAGKLVLKNGGTLFQTNPGGAGSLISATKTLEIDGSGTVKYNLSTSCNCTIYGPTGTNTIAGTGGTTSNGGAGTLIKEGAGEFRYQNVGIANSTYAKLVVNDGLFRLGFAGSTSSELGFGAAPLAPLADAITLNGGAIGTSFGVTLNTNRGITLGANGGWFNNAAATMTVPSVITGAGSLNKDIDPNLIKGSATGAGTLNLTSATGNTYAGGTNINAGNLKVTNTSGSGTGSGPVVVGGSSATQFGTLLGSGSISGSTTLNQFGELRPTSSSTATLDSAGTITLNGGLALSAGSLLTYQIGATGNDKAVVAGVNGLNIAGSMTLNLVANGTVSAGTIPIIDYDTSFQGLLSNIVIGTVPAGFTYSLVNNTTDTTIDLTVTAPGLPGDFNSDGKVDAGDYVTWRKNDGTNNALANDNGLGVPVGAAHYTLWRQNFGNPPGAGSGGGLSGGAVPEPMTLSLIVIGLGFVAASRQRRQ